ncbi:MAG TPA: 8-oxo-dGTP diphosphatase [Clostridia bacterium]|nr:8-oxo-dGTP diphosphatase [Clostridia bacterium]
MKSCKYKDSLRKATLCFLIRGDEVLLAMKKRGFGAGRWNGTGGKPNAGETIEKAAIREAREEVGVTPLSLRKVASLKFNFPHQPDFNQQVEVFLVESWKGEPQETEEMTPKWFNKNDFPFDSMWPGDRFWLPKVLGGVKLEAEFTFGKGDKVLDYKLAEVGELEEEN